MRFYTNLMPSLNSRNIPCHLSQMYKKNRMSNKKVWLASRMNLNLVRLSSMRRLKLNKCPLKNKKNKLTKNKIKVELLIQKSSGIYSTKRKRNKSIKSKTLTSWTPRWNATNAILRQVKMPFPSLPSMETPLPLNS